MADLADVAGLAKLAGQPEDKIGKAVRIYMEHKSTFDFLFRLLKGLFDKKHHEPAPAPAPAAPAAPGPTPVTPPAAASAEPVSLKASLMFVERPERYSGHRGDLEPFGRFNEILAGGNIDDGSYLHTDCTPFMADGSELRPGDPRWAQVNHGWPNGMAVFPYYEFNGKLTKITVKDEGSPEVEPQSVEDDHGCTVTYHITGKGTFRFGYLSLDHAGIVHDSGLIGQGNVVDGAPFNIA